MKFQIGHRVNVGRKHSEESKLNMGKSHKGKCVKDLKNQRFGRLIPIESVGQNKRNGYLWQCQCDCGRKVVVSSGHLLSGHTKSCGCYSKELTSLRAKHGHTRTQNGKRIYSKTYYTWSAMLRRCSNKNHEHYSYYGGKGIKVCDHWLGEHGFENFLADMGERPEGLTIERKNNDGNYEPSNCEWADRKTQVRNRRSAKRSTFHEKVYQ